MQIDEVPSVLRDHLGLEASAGLVQLFNRTQEDWSGQVLSRSTERFERRLVEETSKIRVEMAQGFGALRVEMAQGFGALRVEMAQGVAALRAEMAEQGAALRQEMAGQGATLRQEMAGHRVELLKWAFVFWVGQLGATAALLAFMLRGLGR